MARIHSIKKSGQHIDINHVAHNKTILERSITLMYSTKNPNYYSDFVGLSSEDVEKEKLDLIDENDTTHCLLLLTAIEALIRLDAENKYCLKKKDALSKGIRSIYDRTQGVRIRLDEDLINLRMTEDNPSLKHGYSALKKFFKYRHWLAHGRYWEPKRNIKIDFNSILMTVQNIISETKHPFNV